VCGAPDFWLILVDSRLECFGIPAAAQQINVGQHPIGYVAMLIREIDGQRSCVLASSACAAAAFSVVASSLLSSPPEDSRCARTNQWNCSSWPR
jgi:hypothetical protein